MADYTLNNAWSDIDAVAAAYKAGALVEKGRLYNPTEQDILPVSAKSDGSLWSRSAMVYSFNSMNEYDDFTNEDPEKIKNGDHVWIRSSNLNGAYKYTLYLYHQYGLNSVVEIVSGVTTGGGEGGGYVPPEGGIPADHLSEEVQKKLTEQIVYNFATPTAYEDFFNRYGDDLKRGDIVIILDADGNGKTVVYQLGKNSLDPTALTPVMEIELASGEPGPAGEDAVIWYTNVAPNNSAYFVVSNLLGPAGAVPAPGHMIVSGYTGRGYFITAVDNDAVTIADYSVQVTGTNGADGGYYTIDVEQLNSQNVRFSFTPSKEGMAEILPEVITLPQGPRGTTPVRGTDYWTAADIAEIKSYVDEAVLGGAW